MKPTPMPDAMIAPFDLRIPPRTAPDAVAVELDLVIHASDKGGAAALCGRPTQPDRILVSGSVAAIDCPMCCVMLDTNDGLRDAIEGAALARARLRTHMSNLPVVLQADAAPPTLPATTTMGILVDDLERGLPLTIRSPLPATPAAMAELGLDILRLGFALQVRAQELGYVDPCPDCCEPTGAVPNGATRRVHVDPMVRSIPYPPDLAAELRRQGEASPARAVTPGTYVPDTTHLLDVPRRITITTAGMPPPVDDGPVDGSGTIAFGFVLTPTPGEP